MLLIGVLQRDNLEEQTLLLKRRIAALEGDGQPASGPKTEPSSDIALQKRWLHPDVANHLTPDPFDLIAGDAIQGGTLTRWLGEDVKGWNPITVIDANARKCTIPYILEPLGDYHFQNPDKFAPRLAERVEVTDDFREYTIYLRQGVTWHRPAVDWSNPRYDWLKPEREFTAEDVKFTLDLYLNPQVQAGHWRNYYQDVASCRIIDDHTVVIRWKKRMFESVAFTLLLRPIPKFLYAHDETGTPFPEETLGLSFNEHWYNQSTIGTGPYTFVSWEPGASVKLTRNEAYWGEQPPIKDLVFRIARDAHASVRYLKSRKIDYGYLFSPADYRAEILEGRPDSPFKDGRIQHGFYDRLSYTFIGWNLFNPLFKDKRVRRAMTMCLDRQSILKNIFLGLGVVITGPFYYKSPYYDPKIQPIPYDPQGAIALLKEAGWDDSDGDGLLDKHIQGEKVDFAFTLLINTGKDHWRDVAALFKEALYAIGVHMTVKEVDWPVLQKLRDERDFDCFLGAWGLFWFTDPFGVWHSSQADLQQSSNFIGFKNPAADQIIETLRQTFDVEKRIALSRTLHRIIHEEQPYTFLFTRPRIAAWWHTVRRVVFSPILPQDGSIPWYLDPNN